MSLVAAAVCPCPPLLVPEVAAGASGELDDLRGACDRAVAALVATAARIVVVGDASESRPFDAPGSLRPWGVDLQVGQGDASLALTLGAWLLARAGARPALLHGAARDLSPDAAEQLGRDLAQPGDVALLVMADGTARRSAAAPGAYDDRAERFDARIATALTTADVGSLASLEPELADELWCTGRAPLQVLAGAAGGRAWSAEVTYDEAPYGVGYFVAGWQHRG